LLLKTVEAIAEQARKLQRDGAEFVAVSLGCDGAVLVTPDNSYYGNPFAPHLSIGALKRETFEQWLKLFHETLDEVYEPEVSLLFKERSTIIAGNFMRNLGLY